MAYVLTKNQQSCNIYLYIFIFLGVIYLLNKINKNKCSKEAFADKLENVKFGPNNNTMCSQKCCFTGWHNNVIIKDDNIDTKDIGTKYLTSNFNCNNGINNTGCLCMPTADIKPKLRECNL